VVHPDRGDQHRGDRGASYSDLRDMSARGIRRKHNWSRAFPDKLHRVCARNGLLHRSYRVLRRIRNGCRSRRYIDHSLCEQRIDLRCRLCPFLRKAHIFARSRKSNSGNLYGHTCHFGIQDPVPRRGCSDYCGIPCNHDMIFGHIGRVRSPVRVLYREHSVVRSRQCIRDNETAHIDRPRTLFLCPGREHSVCRPRRCIFYNSFARIFRRCIPCRSSHTARNSHHSRLHSPRRVLQEPTEQQGDNRHLPRPPGQLHMKAAV
jgi:hypothetical protein